MNLQERFNLLFFRNQCIKVIVFDINKRVNSYIIKTNGRKTFSIGEREFVLDEKAVYINSYKSLPTYIYYFDNPEGIVLYNPSDAKVDTDINSAMLYDAIQETIISKIIRYAEDGDKRIINTIMIFGVINVLAIGIAGYLLFTQNQEIINFLNENSDVIKALKDQLLNGGVN